MIKYNLSYLKLIIKGNYVFFYSFILTISNVDNNNNKM